jgi:Fe-Mn family superoxide dismutase
MISEQPTYHARDYSTLKGLAGITDEQIAEHLKLYNGYVNRTNALLKKVEELGGEAKLDQNFAQELMRRVGWEFNGMRLHEYYFDQFGPVKGALTEANKFGAAIIKQWGSVDAWMKEIMAVAKMPGIGWAICYRDPANGQFINTWIEQHEGGHLAGCSPILVVDIFEHAFTVYLKPTERAKYLGDFFANVDWNVVAARI